MSAPLVVTTCKWHTPGYRSTFTAVHVNILRRMVARHYPSPHEFVCITDDAAGIDPDVRIVPIWSDYAEVVSPHGRHAPSCYRRLKLFSAEMADLLGPRFVNFDLDTVITGDLRPVLDREEPFLIWGETDPRSFYNGSMFMMTAGARRDVWEQFDPTTSPMLAYRAGKFGSDQGWISYCLGPGQPTWTRRDGVYSWRVHLEKQGGALPTNARVVHFHGKVDPDSRLAQKHRWVREAYR